MNVLENKSVVRAWLKSVLDVIIDWLGKFMPEKIMKYARHFLSVEFVFFIVVGVINTLSTTVFATIFDLIPQTKTGIIAKYNITFIVGYILSMVISFLLNTYVTFGEKPTLTKALKFPLSYIPNFLIQVVCVSVFKSMNWNNTIAYILAAIIGLPITFITMKILVFKRKN